MGKHTESAKDTKPYSSASAKKTSRGKECAAFGCSNTFCDGEGTATGIHFFNFLLLTSEINRWFNLIKRQNNNPAGNYMFKVNNRNTRTRCEICSKLTIKTPERR